MIRPFIWAAITIFCIFMWVFLFVSALNYIDQSGKTPLSIALFVTSWFWPVSLIAVFTAPRRY